MATSGSFNTTSYSNRNLVFAWTLQSQSIETNTSVISWTLKGGGSASGYYLTQNITLIINGVTVYTRGQEQIKLWNGTTVASGTTSIQHGNTGTKTFSASCEAGIYVWSPNVNGSGSWELPTIPRYASISQSLQSKTETTAVIKWTSDSTCDYLWYSTNNGSSWTGVSIGNATNGTYTISGLTANTTYQVKTRVRRKDSQLSNDSSALAVTTYAYPYANSMPNFTIGNSVTIGIFNPLKRTVTVEMVGADNSTKSGGSVSGTSIAGFNASAWQTFLYASIPNSKTGTYKIKVTYGTHSTTTTGGTYSVKESDCLPVIGAVTYEDTNTDVTMYTHDNQIIVRNKSTVLYTASNLAGTKSASIASASVSVNGQTYAMTISGTSATGGNASIDSSMSVESVVTVTDSRGITATKSITVPVEDWTQPSAIITMARQNNYYTATNLTVDASYSYVQGINHITIAYRIKKTSESNWGSFTVIQDNTQVTFNADNEYSWDVHVLLNDTFGGEMSYYLYLSRGMPIIYFDRLKSSVGVNCFPANNESFEVNGFDFMYHDGSTESMSNVMTDGMITSSGKQVRFSVVLPRICHGLTPAVTEMKLNVRNVAGGYVLTSGFVSGGYNVLTDSDITVTTELVTPNIITFSLDKTSAFNGTNNTPVSVQINSLGLSFS